VNLRAPACCGDRRRGSLTLVVAVFLATTVVAGCDRSGGPCGDGPGIDNTLASTERWLRVVSPPRPTDVVGTVERDFEVVAVGVDGDEGAQQVETIAIHTSFLRGIEQGLAGKEDVFLGLAREGLERELVTSVIVRSSEGGHRFVGECTADAEELLRERLDGHYDPTIDALIGLTGGEQIRELLGSP
jgi:hypothetical protein